jgi:hypothetical protein
LLEDFMQRKTAYVFITGVKDQGMKQHLLMGSKRSLTEALNQALMLEATKAAATPTIKLWEVRAGVPMGTHTPATECHWTG